MLRVGNVSAFGRQALGRDKPCPYGCETHGFIPVGATLVVARGWILRNTIVVNPWLPAPNLT